MMKFRKQCKLIAKEYRVSLTEITKGDKYCIANSEDSYINSSYVAGREIYLGIYDDEELLLISFFHELGHVTDKIDWSIGADSITKYESEKNAWMIGYEIAGKYGIEFSDVAKQWVFEQLGTYKRKEEIK